MEDAKQTTEETTPEAEQGVWVGEAEQEEWRTFSEPPRHIPEVCKMEKLQQRDQEGAPSREGKAPKAKDDTAICWPNAAKGYRCPGL